MVPNTFHLYEACRKSELRIFEKGYGISYTSSSDLLSHGYSDAELLVELVASSVDADFAMVSVAFL